ncbi:MAG: hypothetical protein DRP54_07065 [Spirochaetes bacterium]|nr:MAG: hypothetical protein DRP54_07065 [Spirochaetota bacterium]
MFPAILIYYRNADFSLTFGQCLYSILSYNHTLLPFWIVFVSGFFIAVLRGGERLDYGILFGEV